MQEQDGRDKKQIEDSRKGLPTEASLRELGVILQDDHLVEVERFFDGRMRSESWIYGYSIVFEDADGNTQIRYLKEKNIISIGGDLTFKAETHRKRFEHIEGLGVPIPKTYGVRNAALYQEFIVNDKTQMAFDEIKKNESPERARDLLDQLIRIAAAIDSAGYRNVGFLTDLIFDGDRDMFVLIDTGEDLGDPDPKVRASNCRQALERAFPAHGDYVSERYAELRGSIEERSCLA